MRKLTITVHDDNCIVWPVFSYTMQNTENQPVRAPILTIRPSKGWSAINVKELYLYRDLLFVFAFRDIKLRYRQTLLGPAWILLQPLLGAGVLSFIFGGIAKLKAPGHLPYFVYCFTGQLGFAIFAGVVTKVSGSLVGNSHLVAKVYFPRLLLPFSTVFAVLVDFCAASLILPFLFAYYHIIPGLSILLLPVWVLLFALLAMGIGLCAAALMVSYRDVTSVLNVLMGFLPYLSAVGFDMKDLPKSLRPFVAANPVAGLLEGFRWSLLSSATPNTGHILYAVAWAVGMFLVGVFSFKRMEKRFADVI